MKHFRDIASQIFSPECLLWVFPILLIVPNVALCFTEHYAILPAFANIMLPLGIYYLIVSISRNIGCTVLCCLPFMVYAAFQIVLLYLFGGGIIAVDMFINVATTNVTEATELLSNLTVSLIIITLLYVTPIVWSVVLLVQKSKTRENVLRKPRRVGIAITIIGLVLLLGCYLTNRQYNISRQMFPVNVVFNTYNAVARVKATTHYKRTSMPFNYKTRSTRDKNQKEVYVLVLGETSRAASWQLMGYDRKTNPRLSKRNNLLTYNKVLTESNTTHKSVPMLLSYLDSRNFGDSIYSAKSVISAFNHVGYHTGFLSNQRRNHSFIDYFGEEAQQMQFIIDTAHTPQLDGELLPLLEKFIADSPCNKIFVVLHSYGAHFKYQERYPRSYSVFKPDKKSDAISSNRDNLINAYDNALLYTDAFLDEVINSLDALDCMSAMVYVADHGEDIFDDSRERFLHSSPTPTYYQIHIPLLVWMSDEYVEAYPEKIAAGKKLENAQISSTQSVFHTLLDIAGLETPYFDPKSSIINKNYCEPQRLYITDYNEAVPLEDSGLLTPDFEQLDARGINYK